MQVKILQICRICFLCLIAVPLTVHAEDKNIAKAWNEVFLILDKPKISECFTDKDNDYEPIRILAVFSFSKDGTFNFLKNNFKGINKIDLLEPKHDKITGRYYIEKQEKSQNTISLSYELASYGHEINKQKTQKLVFTPSYIFSSSHPENKYHLHRTYIEKSVMIQLHELCTSGHPS